ncbi:MULTISPECIES: hypothetical protein [Kitasatospora]|uniref:Uncharacterized protein n=1 Tax=Kitasatospora setae (strain ATCC 33774 / DSM 43861 / JCM 3304 / KCC A-0304 / NBRC 14216 / KM-6054) TaxID=452652 RepID=E4NJ83_KITSK|nr:MULTISPECIES: hypothetical protein [Kitasatospora]BAJ33031.1 hypothetical protein KSE_72760 [Kitasatospora setae KM-6054]
MDFDRHIIAPGSPNARQWRTFDSERTVPVAARTATSLVRVLEVLPEPVAVFAHDAILAFGGGVPELLRSLRCHTLPWNQLTSAKPDLMISASEHTGVPAGEYPVLVLAGIGRVAQDRSSRAAGSFPVEIGFSHQVR